MLETLNYNNLKNKAVKFGGWISLLLIFSIHFSTFLTLIFSLLLIVLWLFSGQFLQLFSLLKKNSILLYSTLLLLIFFSAVFYSSAPMKEAFKVFLKYREFLLLIIVIPFLSTPKIQYRAVLTFIIALIVSMIISYGMAFDFIPPKNIEDPFSFKNRITHSIFMAFLSFYACHKIYLEKKYQRFFWLIIYGMAFYNLFFIASGRTGQILFFGLTLLFAFQHFKIKKIAVFVILFIIFMGLFLSFSDKASRLKLGVTNTTDFFNGKSEKSDTSMGIRLKFWKKSLIIIGSNNLFLGTGTGSFANEYKKISDYSDFSNNPHNEYLLITVQLGGVGLILFLLFLYSQYYQSRDYKGEYKYIAQGTLLMVVATSFVNSPILDHTEGHWFIMLIALCLSSKNYTEKNQNG